MLHVQFQEEKTLCDIYSSNFQALVNIHGAVVCKETCGPSVSVTLVRLAGKHNEERKTVSLTDESSEFLFSSVLPGKYRLEVRVIIPRLLLFVIIYSCLIQFFVMKTNGKKIMWENYLICYLHVQIRNLSRFCPICYALGCHLSSVP